jgi:cation diffusion facilitator CzcD-associated flavoprotein CzcO
MEVEPEGQVDVLVVGAGFGGLYALYKMRRQGLSAVVIEAAPSVGGTWYANRYPGARVDIESLDYSYSFSEELQQEWRWSERYSSQPELLRYANHVADRFGLRDGIELNTRVTSAHFDEAAGRWRVDCDDGRKWTARFVIMATGPLSTPNTPRFEGLESFSGSVLHSAAWPHEPIDFSGRRVAVVGTGTSAVQIIPTIAPQVETLTVFQRTAAYVVPAHNGPLDPTHEASIKSDYAGYRARSRLKWTGFYGDTPANPASALAASAEELHEAFESRWRIGGFVFLRAFADLATDMRANAHAAEFVRGKIREIVADPKTAAALSPQQPIGCKRLAVDANGYYETFNLPNVKLVDVGQHPIEAVTPRGLVAGRRQYEFDTLILATGFDAVTGTLTRMDLQGRDGLQMREKWRGGPSNYLGLATSGFPNLFHVAGPGSTAAFTNVIVSIEHHINWIGECIAWLDAHGHETIEAGEQAEADWMAFVQEVAAQTVFLNCNSWYLGANIPGKPRVFMAMAMGYPAYAQRCARVATNGYEGFVVA